MKGYENNNHTEEREVYTMPTIELIEYEKVACVKEMEEYLRSLKSMKKSDGKKISHENLMKSGIITESGEFTERYKFSKMILQKKGQ